jgi:GT2 family glycosyltransferase
MWEPYFVYSDDSDFVYRARKSGYKIAYLGEVEVFHRVGYLTGGSKSAFSRFYGTRNRVLMIRRHAKGLEVYILAWAYLATIWIRSKLKREPAIEFQQRAEGYKNAWGIQTR